MDKKTRNILIGVGVAGLLLFLWNRSKNKPSKVISGEIDVAPPSGGAQKYEEHLSELLRKDIIEKGEELKIPVEIRKAAEKEDKFADFTSELSEEDLLEAIALLDKEEFTQSDLTKFTKILTKK